MIVVQPTGRARRGPGIALAFALAALAVGCSGETGIVLEIHKAPGVSSEVFRMQIFAGVGHDADLFDPAWWVSADLDESEAMVGLDDEMAAATYRYLVKPGGGLGLETDIVFAVAGYKNDADLKPVVFGHSEAPVHFAEGEVRVYDFPLVTFADARHGVTATGCAWWDDQGTRIKRDAIAPRDDGDCDAYRQDSDSQVDCVLDCNDSDPAINPGAAEVCADGIDQNCCDDNDGQDDLDGDGFARCGTATPDCVDRPPGTAGVVDVFGEEVPSNEIHPGATELCDGVDNNCSDGCDEPDSFDPDGDGYLNCSQNAGDEVFGVHRLADGCEASPPDCLEVARIGAPPPASVNPGAHDDDCDGWDDNCDGTCDEDMVALGDQDDDGFPACTTESAYVSADVPQCRLGVGADCGGDDSAFEYPGRTERCDGIDFDCDNILFPALSPCFVIETEGMISRCLIGHRPCDDTPGGTNPGFGACARDANSPATVLPMEWCTNTCSQPTDPLQCLGSQGASCDVYFPAVDSLATCNPPPAEIPLPQDSGTGGCSYALVGGMVQGDWSVSLINPQGIPGPTAVGCGSKLHVEGSRPDADDRVVLVVSAVAPHVYQLKRKNQCDSGGQGSLVCSP